jgi:hypothetical protein
LRFARPILNGPSHAEIPGAKRRKADRPPRLMARKAKRTDVRAGA